MKIVNIITLKKFPRYVKLPKFSIIFALLFFVLFSSGNFSLYEKNPNEVKVKSPSVSPTPYSLESKVKQNLTKPNSESFNWTVEKVDEHLTKMQLPADDHMSTANELFDAMNNYRKAHNIGLIDQTPGICDIAQKRAQEQLGNGDLDGHAGFDKYVQNQNELSAMGEVLFGGSQPQSGVHIIEFGWNRSLTGHKEAIQNPDWHYGCGGVAGYFAVFIFGKK